MTPLHEAHIRPYDVNDRISCMLAFQSNLPEFFTIPEIAQFERWLNRFDPTTPSETGFHFYYFVVVLNQQLIGCGGFVYEIDKNKINFAWGLIDRSFHKKGFGKMLFDYRIKKMKELYPTATIVLDTTQHSYTFFQKYGFVTEKYTADGYTTGMHRYDMKLKEE